MIGRPLKVLGVLVVGVIVFGFGTGLGAAARWRALGSPPISELVMPPVSTPDDPGPSTGARPEPPPRTPTRAGRGPCRSTYAVHAMYVVPADAPDRGLHHGSIQASIGALQEWLAGQTGGRRLRVVCSGTSPSVAFHRLGTTAAAVVAAPDSHHLIAAELRTAGFDAATRIYAVYYDGPLSGYCGVAAGRVAIYTVWTRSVCRSDPAAARPVPSNAEFGMAHEIFHTLGAVPRCAPHRASDSAHVTDDRRDVMYPGGDPALAILDVGRDDYYGHGRPGCPDLADSILLDPAPPGAVPPPGWPPPR